MNATLKDAVNLLRLVAAGDRDAVDRALDRLAGVRGPLLLAADLVELAPEGLAAKDAAEVIAAADAAVKDAADLELYGYSCLVSGSMLSPSWRALSGGSKVWGCEPVDGDPDPDLCERYVEALDEILDGWSGPDDETIGWNEGDLFVSDRDADEVDGDRRD